jgi:cytochrome c
MSVLKASMVVFGLVTAVAGSAWSQEARGTADQAKALLDKAVAHYAKVGRAQALTDFNDRQGSFVDRDLYVFCFGPGRQISAHGMNAALVGKDIAIFKDHDGKAFATEMYDLGTSNGNGKIDYQWVNPTTKKIEPKSSHFQKVASDEVCAVGYYK